MLKKFVVLGCLLTSFAELPAAPAVPAAEPTSITRRPRRLGGLRRAKPRREARILGLAPLLRIESVRQELQLDDQQKTVVEDMSVSLREDFRGDIRTLVQALRERPDRPREREGQLSDKLNGQIQQALKPEQFERLQQIGWQLDLRRAGPAALSSQDLAGALDLSPEQKQQLEELAHTMLPTDQLPTDQLPADQLPADQLPADQPPADESPALTAPPLIDRPALTDIRSIRSATQEILTDQQQTKLENLLGPEFDLPEALLQQQPTTESSTP